MQHICHHSDWPAAHHSLLAREPQWADRRKMAPTRNSQQSHTNRCLLYGTEEVCA